MIFKFISVVLLTLFLMGCGSNPYKDFYQPNPQMVQAPKEKKEQIKEYPVEIIRVGGNPDDLEKSIQNYSRSGFGILGYSNFQASEVNDDQLIAQAREVGATKALLGVKYLRTNSGSMPLTLPNTQTTFHSGSLSGYGGYGSYSGTSTTYGTRTTYIPYSVNRYEYIAAYLKKITYKLGIRYDLELPNEIKQKLGTHKGVLIKTVVKNSPAYNADILEGDVIKKMNGLIVDDGRHLDLYLKGLDSGENVQFEILRNNEKILKQVTLN